MCTFFLLFLACNFPLNLSLKTTAEIYLNLRSRYDFFYSTSQSNNGTERCKCEAAQFLTGKQMRSAIGRPEIKAPDLFPSAQHKGLVRLEEERQMKVTLYAHLRWGNKMHPSVHCLHRRGWE